MARSKSGKNRFLGWRGTCAAAAIGILAILLLPRSCGEESVKRWGGDSGPGTASATARIQGHPEPAPPPMTPADPSAADHTTNPAPGDRLVKSTLDPGAGGMPGHEPDPGPRRGASIPVTAPSRIPPSASRGDVRAANRPRGAGSRSRRTYSFTAAPRNGDGGWADEHKYIRQGEFAMLLLEAMQLPRPQGGWQPQVAACTLSVNVGCGDQPVVALRRQAPFPDDLDEERAFRSPAATWIGERPVMPSSGWRVKEFLTEGEMVEVLGQIGVQVYSSEPEKLVSWKLARRVLGKFQGVLVPSGSMVTGFIGDNETRPPRGNPAPRLAMSASVP